MQCIRCNLLLPTCTLSVRQSTRLHCAKTAELIKMLLEVTLLWAHGTLCYTWVLIPSHTGGSGPTFKFLDPLVSLKQLKQEHLAEEQSALHWHLTMHIHGCWSYPKLHKVGNLGILGGVTWLTFKFCNCLHISGMATATESCVCGAFDAAFAKLLWLLVYIMCYW